MKRFFLTCFLLLPSFFFAQSTWYMDLPSTDFAGKCVATYDGGVVTVSLLENKVTKLDDAGTLLWSYVLDSGVQFLDDVIETEDHGIVAYGPMGGYTATHVVKLDENGNRLWEKNLAITGQSLTADFICPAHGDGGFLIGGGECAMQFYIVRCDPNGDVQWVQQFAGLTTASTGFFSDVVQAPGSGYICNYSKLDNGDLDWGLLKIDDNGAYVWATALDEGAERDETEHMIATQAGGVAVLGITTNNSTNNEYKMTLTTFDGSGSRLSYHIYDYSEQLQPRVLTQTSDGGFVLSGSTFSLTTLLIKTDIQGNIQWQKVGNGASSQEGFGLAPASAGMFYLSAGDFNHKHTVAKLSASSGQGVCNEGPIQLSTSSGQPPMVPTVATAFTGVVTATSVNYPHHTSTTQPTLVCTVVAEDLSLPTPTLQVGPNPFADMLMVDFGQAAEEDGLLLLHDLQGKLMASTVVSKGSTNATWSLPKIAAGVYSLEWRTASISTNLKVVKMKD